METFEQWINQKLDEWWKGLSDGSQEALAGAARENRMDQQTVRTLIESRCPIGPSFTQWNGNDDGTWSWTSRVRDYVLAK